jgi:predicted SAM-dependent methyltransferase
MVLHDLEKLPLPFEANSFDEIHAYEVCEHVTGQQGDEVAFFAFFTEMARILKPNGVFFATVPRGPWVWADPSHKREITINTLTFLSQDAYKQVGETCMSDYRNIYKADFDRVWATEIDAQTRFVLRVNK